MRRTEDLSDRLTKSGPDARRTLAAWQGMRDATDLLEEPEPQGPPANPSQDLVLILLWMEERMVRLEAKLDRALASKA